MALPLRARLLPLLALLACGFSGCASADRTPVDMSDPAIVARIKAELKSHRISIRLMDIDVHVGIVTLSGSVESYEQRQEVTRLVNQVAGVRQLLVNLLIQE
ncbi:MAG TPA: BON domain-containing protein [Elusimicrobiota bacterium]|jgi:osmotically-inducible protein OsmY|nr:BON domain-containing protein [Elusimicrobiota bacterium]